MTNETFANPKRGGEDIVPFVIPDLTTRSRIAKPAHEKEAFSSSSSFSAFSWGTLDP